MDMISLEIFVKTAEEKNITRAAEFMHMSQPTVSRRIRELEEEFGRQLFIRTNKSVSLTDEGRQFWEAASDMLTIYRKVRSQEKDHQVIKGDIYIGSGEIPAFSILAKQIREFRSLQPGVCFHIQSGNAGEICEDVEKGVLDLGLIARSVNTESFESLEYPGKSRWGVLIKEEHPLALQKQITVEELKGESLILPENRVYYRELTAWFSESPDIAAAYTLAHNALQLVKQGLGPMLCFEDPALLPEGFAFIPIIPERWATPLLIWKKRAVQSDVVKTFLQFISSAQTANPLQPSGCMRN